MTAGCVASPSIDGTAGWRLSSDGTTCAGSGRFRRRSSKSFGGARHDTWFSIRRSSVIGVYGGHTCELRGRSWFRCCGHCVCVYGKARSCQSLDFTADYGSSHHDNMVEESSELYRIAREKMDAGDYVEAVRLFEASAAILPHFKTLELLGECRIHLGLLREAVVPLAAATTLNIQPRAPALLADVLLRLGETENASRIAQ